MWPTAARAALLGAAALVWARPAAARPAAPERTKFLGAARALAQDAPPAAAETGADAGDSSTNFFLRPDVLPNFAAMRAEQAAPAVDLELRRGEETLRRLEALAQQGMPNASYEALVLPLEGLAQAVGHPWEMLNHLKSVRDAPPIREAVNKLQPRVMEFWQKVSQSKPIYQALLQLSSSPDFAQLPEARRRIVRKELLDRRLGGVGLEAGAAAEFNNLQTRLSNLSMTFSNRVLDARKAWSLTITDADRLRGIPNRTLAVAVDFARGAGSANATAAAGPWMLTMDQTQVMPALTHAEDRSLRETLFRATMQLASQGEYDNTATVTEMLAIRQRQAEILGYPNYAALSFASKMANSSSVHSLLDQLQATGKPAAERDEAELQEFARRTGGPDPLQPWDRPFYAERLRKERFGIDAEKLRAYFAFPTVLQGLFGLCDRLFGVSLEAEEGHNESLWDPDVRLYRATRDGQLVGYVFVDPYSRPSEKRSGAWMQGLAPREQADGRLRLPVAAVVTNFPAPAPGGDRPSLLSLAEVDTLFHEFGHALQHVLTIQNETAVSGINGIEWDAVEVASQFMEFWADFDRTTMYSFARHYETGEPLPEDVYKRIREAHGFRAGTGLVSKVYLGKVDLKLHEGFVQGEDTNAIEKAVAQEVLVAQPIPEARPLCSFRHIFSSGYDAGYYSYQWSEVLSADAFSAFESGGALADGAKARAIGARFAGTLLALGGGRDPGQVFMDFRGRAPTPEALLRYSGLVQGTVA